jgi:hypothetical protein
VKSHSPEEKACMLPAQTENNGVSWDGRHLSGILRHGRSTIVLNVGPASGDGQLTGL